MNTRQSLLFLFLISQFLCFSLECSSRLKRSGFVDAVFYRMHEGVAAFLEQLGMHDVNDPALIDHRWGMTLLHTAALHGYKDVAEVLVARGANKNAKTFSDTTAYELALRHGYTALLPILETDKIRADRIKKIQQQIINNDWRSMEDLIQKAGLDCRFPDGATLLHHAAAQSYQAKVIELLERGLNPLLTDQNGDTALHLAVRNDRLIVCSILVACRAVDIRVKNKSGLAPFDYAKDPSHRCYQLGQALLRPTENLPSPRRILPSTILKRINSYNYGVSSFHD